jgi:hypothetical protein
MYLRLKRFLHLLCKEYFKAGLSNIFMLHKEKTQFIDKRTHGRSFISYIKKFLSHFIIKNIEHTCISYNQLLGYYILHIKKFIVTFVTRG